MLEKHCRECGCELIEKELKGEGCVPYCTRCGEFRFPMYNVAVSMIVINRHVSTADLLLFSSRDTSIAESRLNRLLCEK